MVRAALIVLAGCGASSVAPPPPNKDASPRFVEQIEPAASPPPLDPTLHTGVLDNHKIHKVIATSMPKLAPCYEQQLAKQVDVAARVDVIFTIGTTGSVTDVHAAGINAEIEACIVDVFHQMRFPSPVGGTATVHYPLRIRFAGN
jgi:hypothetical protein